MASGGVEERHRQQVRVLLPGARRGDRSTRRIEQLPRDDANTRLIKFVQMLRCVPSAPFGLPVVPDV